MYIMANTRFNYDDARTVKNLQESTGPGKYMLNVPGNGEGKDLHFYEDPFIRQQRWGANLMNVRGGHPIDIDSNLIGLDRRLAKDCRQFTYDKFTPGTWTPTYLTKKGGYTKQSRTTHPAWLYLDLEQNHRGPLFLDPQENLHLPFHNNINTRILERDAYDERNYKYSLSRINNQHNVN